MHWKITAFSRLKLLKTESFIPLDGRGGRATSVSRETCASGRPSSGLQTSTAFVSCLFHGSGSNNTVVRSSKTRAFSPGTLSTKRIPTAVNSVVILSTFQVYRQTDYTAVSTVSTVSAVTTRILFFFS